MHSPLLTMELDFILSDIRSGGKLGKLRSWTSFGCLRETDNVIDVRICFG